MYTLRTNDPFGERLNVCGEYDNAPVKHKSKTPFSDNTEYGVREFIPCPKRKNRRK